MKRTAFCVYHLERSPQVTSLGHVTGRPIFKVTN